MRPPSLSLAAILCSSGCIYPHLRAGPAQSLTRPDQDPIVAAEASVDLVAGPQGPVEIMPKIWVQAWSPAERAAFGYGWSIRGKAGSRLGQLATGFHLTGQLRLFDRGWVGMRAGAHLLQLDVVDGRFGGAIGSPYVQTHLGLRLGDELTVFVSPWWEHDLRFGPAPDEAFAGVAIGLSLFPIP